MLRRHVGSLLPAATGRRCFMRPALYLTPMSPDNLALAAQAGATDIVAPYTTDVQQVADTVAAAGMRLSVIERYLPHDAIVHGTDGAAAQVQGVRDLVRAMGDAGVTTLCYNWMPKSDWSRTRVDAPARGNSLVTEFDAGAAGAVHLSGQEEAAVFTPSRRLWDNLRRFLDDVLPVAESAGVTLALHPDDPPLPVVQGNPQVVFSVAALQRAVALAPSAANGVCFCQGTLASAGVDIPDAIRRLAPAIKYVHFRDVTGSVPHFREAWHDSGDTDMAAAVRAYHDIGFTGPIRPDHVPTMHTEDNSTPGYHMLGRLWALGYMAGLMEGVTAASTPA